MRTRRETTQSRRRRILSEMAFLGGFLLLAVTTRASLADHYVVPTGSMLPTVEIGDRILVNKAAHGLRLPLTETWLLRGQGPETGEVVVLASPEDGDVLLKRVIAVPGDVVAVRAGRIWLNGTFAAIDADGREALGDVRHPVRLGTGGPDFGPVQVPEARYLVMGDNRGDSLDGRLFGWVRREAILGRATGVFFRAGRPTWAPLSGTRAR